MYYLYKAFEDDVIIYEDCITFPDTIRIKFMLRGGRYSYKEIIEKKSFSYLQMSCPKRTAINENLEELIGSFLLEEL